MRPEDLLRRHNLREWVGGNLKAIVTDEAYGMHFSVSAMGRKPTDIEVTRAREHFPQADGCSVEVTHNVSINPYVRHFISPEAVANTPYMPC